MMFNVVRFLPSATRARGGRAVLNTPPSITVRSALTITMGLNHDLPTLPLDKYWESTHNALQMHLRGCRRLGPITDLT